MQGWAFFQVGKGGKRFVALQTVSWTTYGVSLALSLANNLVMKDVTLEVSALAFGVMSYGLTMASLLVYQPAQAEPKQQVAVPSVSELRSDRVFNAAIQSNTALMHSGEGVTDLWWVFLAVNFVVAAVGSWVGWRAPHHTESRVLRMLATTVTLWAMAFSTALTHAIGGQWRHVSTGYMAIMPGRGGASFVALQTMGWSLFTVCEAAGLVSVALLVRRP